MIRRPPRSTLFPTRRSSDLAALGDVLDVRRDKLQGLRRGDAPKTGELADERLARELTRGDGNDLRMRSEEHTSELQSHVNLVCRLLLEKKKNKNSARV